jgi:hypothetical protein
MRLPPTALAIALVMAACADDGGGSTTDSSTTSGPTTTAPTTTTEAVPVDTTFLTEDVDALCAALDGLGDIDPTADPTQADVDRLRAIAGTAPPGVAEPLEQVADLGQRLVDGGEVEAGGDLETAAAEGATLLIAYGNEACGIDVPLLDSIAGVG